MTAIVPIAVMPFYRPQSSIKEKLYTSTSAHLSDQHASTHNAYRKHSSGDLGRLLKARIVLLFFCFLHCCVHDYVRNYGPVISQGQTNT